MPTLRTLFTSLLILAAAPMVQADQVRVAVAANFTAAMKAIGAGFHRATGHRALISYGSTGKLYTQIVHGAPFAVFLAADQARPRRLVEENRATDRFTYATGKLVLWSAGPRLENTEGELLRGGEFARLAIANPKTAPYGAAAIEVLRNLGLHERLARKLVRGDSIAQTYQFVATGNAEVGFVALAQVALDARGSRREVPDALYSPLHQDAVLLAKGADQPAARALLDYLKGPEARAVIERYGYEPGP